MKLFILLGIILFVCFFPLVAAGLAVIAAGLAGVYGFAKLVDRICDDAFESL